MCDPTFYISHVLSKKFLKKVEKQIPGDIFFWNMNVFLVSRREAKSALETKNFNCTFYNIKLFMPFTNN